MQESPLFFDDLQVGREWRTAARRVDAELIAAFSAMSGDLTPIHLDPQAARQAGYPRVVAHGPLVLALAVGLLSQLGHLTASTLAIRRLEWEFSRPVLAEDLISCLARVAAMRAISASAGLADISLEVQSTDGRTLQRGMLRLLLRRSSSADQPAQTR